MYNMVHHLWNHLLSQGGKFGQGSLWVSVSFFTEHILLLVLVALPQVAEQVLQSDQSPDESPVTRFTNITFQYVFNLDWNIPLCVKMMSNPVSSPSSSSMYLKCRLALEFSASEDMEKLVFWPSVLVIEKSNESWNEKYVSTFRLLDVSL